MRCLCAYYHLYLGVPAEKVAGQAVAELINNIDAGGCVDEHLQDQVRRKEG